MVMLNGGWAVFPASLVSRSGPHSGSRPPGRRVCSGPKLESTCSPARQVATDQSTGRSCSGAGLPVGLERHAYGRARRHAHAARAGAGRLDRQRPRSAGGAGASIPQLAASMPTTPKTLSWPRMTNLSDLCHCLARRRLIVAPMDRSGAKTHSPEMHVSAAGKVSRLRARGAIARSLRAIGRRSGLGCCRGPGRVPYRRCRCTGDARCRSPAATRRSA